jgi:hypothetical protein
MRKTDAYLDRRALAGHELNGEAGMLSPSLKRLVDHLALLPVPDCLTAWDGYCCGLPDPDAVIAEMAAVDRLKPMPEAPKLRSGHRSTVQEALPRSPARCTTLDAWRRLAAARIYPPTSTPRAQP